MTFKQMQFATLLFGLGKVINRTAKKHPVFKARLAEKNFTAQIKIIDDSVGRYFTFDKGKVVSGRGLHDNPDICMLFKDAELAVKLLMPPRDHLAMINAMKNFQIGLQGPDDLTMWFMETLNQILTSGMEYGTAAGNGVKRYTSNTNGGPVFVYVKDNKIIRITPIEFDDSDADPWTIT
ncbi:MAG: hypothetical protein OET63_14815, partial [Desulfobacterales bacterium]|nr:hypothetical protein [Desulfobacterales bacterium]